ncbi:hypothetical protein CHU98_g1410 [Xylaria longipes]|nr:hypothetical protein CHU98_g1410 [Xylaria longipes]
MAYASDNSGFFIESDEPRRINVKDAAKILARNRQEMIANELSRLAGDEYLEDMMQHTRHMEDETLPDANLIDMQREIQWFMRPYLIDFLIEAHAAFALLPETLFLTINLLDRYCSKRVVYKQHYQLVGCAALLIAAKYGDKKDRVPQINELNNMCCGLYDSGMFTQMEMHVLNTLDWTIGHPTVDFFTQLIVAEEADDREVEHMAAYLCEIALYHRDFVSTKPSIMARASLALSRAILGRPEANDGAWDNVEHLTVESTTSTPFSSCRADDGFESLCHLQHSPKGSGAAPGPADGYITPPITPDGLCFAAADPLNKYVPPRCPVTPTPQVPSVAGYSQRQQPQHYATYPYDEYHGQMVA